MNITRKLVASIVFAGAAVGGALLGALPAKATTFYNFTFNSNNETAVGTLEVNASNQIIGIWTALSGDIAANTVGNGIILNNGFPNQQNSYGFLWDNVFSPTQPYLNNNGVLFNTLSNNLIWNLFSNSPTDYELYTYGGPGIPQSAFFGTLSLAVAQTPLPAALPLFATGLAALGLLRRRRRMRKMADVAAV
jgi:hypothetical protein